MAQTKPTYNSNPFTLSFEALGKFFKFNLVWPIVLISFEVLGFIWNMFSTLINAITESQTTSTYSSSTASSTSLEPAAVVAIVMIVLVFVLFAIAIGSVIATYVNGMYAYVSLKSLEDKKVGFGEAFSAVTKRFWRLYLATLLAGLKIVGWTLLFIIPGIRAALRYTVLPYVIMSDSEKEKSVAKSHARTKQIVRHRLMEVFGIWTVKGLIPLVGTSIGYIAPAALHNQLATYTDKNLEKPKIHWLNYIGFIIAGVLFALGLLIVSLILIIASAS